MINKYWSYEEVNIIVGSSDPSSSTSGGATEASSSASGAESTAADSCQCQCCSDPSIPHHPLDLSSSGVTHTHRNKGSGMKSYSRRIQPSWYESFPWISVCSLSLKIYCSTCRTAKLRGLLTFPKHYKSAFVDDGFKNLKKALERFREHEKCYA